MTDIEPAIRKALRPRIGNVERRTRYLLDAHAVAVAAALAQARQQYDDARRIMAVHIDDLAETRDRLTAERDEARETAANLATVWDRERETLAAHVGALEGELERVKDQAAEDVHALGGACGEIEALTAERDALAAERDRLREQVDGFLAERKARRDEFASAITDIADSEREFYAKQEPAPGSPPARKPPMSALPPTAAESIAIAGATQTPAAGATPAPGEET